MDRDANYVAVGAFVLLILVLGAGFVLWYTDSADGEQAQRDETYFEGGVSGLSEGGSVRSLGVAVGRVVRIGIDPRDSRLVRVVADIRDDTPIKGDTVARLSLQGITGVLYVNLVPRGPGSQPRAAAQGRKHPAR